MDINLTRPRRSREIKAAIEAKPYAHVPTEVARNLFRLLEEAKAEGHRKGDIANRAWEGNPDDLEYNAKQLARVVLAPDAPPGREMKLDKKPANYVAVAKAWAQVMGRSEDDTLLRIFANTEFGSALPEVLDDNYDSWELIAAGLRECALHILRLHNLKDYYRKVQSTSGRYDARAGFVAARQSLWINLGGLALRATCSDEVEPVPSIRLARRLQCPPTAGIAWLDPKIWTAVSTQGRAPYLSNIGLALFANARSGIDPIEFGKTKGMVRTACIYRLWLEIRLAIGPEFNEEEVAPLIEIRTNLELEIDGKKGELDNPFTDGSDIVRTVLLDGRIHRIAVEPPSDLPPAFRSRSFDQTEHTYFAWAPLGAPQLREVLDESQNLLNGWSAFEHEPSIAPESSLFPHGPLSNIESRLRSGELDRELSADATRLALMLEQYRTRIRTNFEADMERLAEERTRTEKAAEFDKKSPSKEGEAE